MQTRHLFLSLLLATTAALPSAAQEGVPSFRAQLNAPLMFNSAGGSDTGGSNDGPVPTPQAPNLSLGAHVFAAGTVGDEFFYDFSNLLTIQNGRTEDVEWAIGSPSDIPSGTGLSSSLLSGTFDEAGRYQFQIVAAHDGAEVPAAEGYTIVVNGAALQVMQISAGGGHTCAVTTTGGAKCWGLGSWGAIGNNSKSNQIKPVDVSGLTSGVASISAGSQHTCAVKTDGSAYCWGTGGSGRLGIGGTSDAPVPVQLTSLGTNVSSIAAGSSHTCAVLKSGQAMCWGSNTSGELGINSSATNHRTTPVAVHSLTSVASISTGSWHTCALTSAGAAYCWGRGSDGQLGLEQGTGNQIRPMPVHGLSSGVVSLSVGQEHSCAAMATGGVKCWGDSSYGEVGDGYKVPRTMPVDVAQLGMVATSVVAGQQTTCASSSQSVKCWGYNGNGNVGGVSSQSAIVLPTPVQALGRDPVQVSVGSSHTCAVSAEGAECWGYNGYGQLGNNSTKSSSSPVDVVSN